MHPVVALCLGFRVEDGKVKQDQSVEPLGMLHAASHIILFLVWLLSYDLIRCEFIWFGFVWFGFALLCFALVWHSSICSDLPQFE